MNHVFPLIIFLILGLIIGGVITYYVVRAATKDALKQTEYYLEILAKKAIDQNSKK
ncbi:hypothetical protein MKJ01_05390 [Chryseobacterium sp. SSA4.19]|uniref:hypothetical protein n=1 Tax=Chryseobacterium sp. SSA4.19 TaxID=2919915 RepID=UPI001F4EDF1B|nr:hypothetical protein [Chryseobacterium sp. SSA4.19]MCJ8153194.1 hypothetical protein [Chryseobacterium sp. SSA4.19]